LERKQRSNSPRGDCTSSAISNGSLSQIIQPALDAGVARGPLGGLVGLGRCCDLLVYRCHRLVERVDFTDERVKRHVYAIWKQDRSSRRSRRQPGASGRRRVGAPGRHDADLGETPTHGVERRRTPARNQLARLMARERSLVLNRTERLEPLARPPHIPFVLSKWIDRFKRV
jgi:hypothetical protein